MVSLVKLFVMAGDEPELVQLLIEFAHGHRLSDQCRSEMISFLAERGHISGEFDYYRQGQKSRLAIGGYEIVYGPMEELEPEIEQHLELAFKHLNDDDGLNAIRELELAQELAPSESNSHATILNNLAAAYEMIGMSKTADQIGDELLECFPNYFFSKLLRAQRLLSDDKHDEVRKIVAELQQNTRLHVTEMSGLFHVLVSLAIAKGDMAAASSQLNCWEELIREPGPEYDRLRAHVELYKAGEQELLKENLAKAINRS